MFILMLTSAVALFLAYAGFVIYEMTTVKSDMKVQLERLAKQIGWGNSAELLFGNSSASTNNLENVLRGDPAITAACIYDTRGEIFAKYPANAEGIPSHQPPEMLRFEKNYLVLSRAIPAPNQSVTVPVYLKSSLQPMYGRLRQYAGVLGGIFLASLLAAIGLSSLLQRIISGPILHLLQTARAVTEHKNYAVRAVKSSDDELGVLTDGINAMLTQIQERDAALQMAHDELERRVERRTQALKMEMAERLRAEKAVSASEERFKLVARATNDAVWDWNLYTNGLWWNEGFESLFGYTRDQIQPGLESWTSRVHPDDYEGVLERRRGVISSGENYWSDEYRFRRADESYAYIFDRGYVIRDELQKPVRMVGAMVDITERKESERALQQQLARISLLNRITHAISERQDLQSLIRTVLEQLERHLPVDFGAIWLYDAKTDHLTCSAIQKTRAQGDTELDFFRPGATSTPDSLGLRACVQGRPMYINRDFESDALQPLVKAGFPSIIASPLREENETFGILACARAERGFSSGECEFIGMLSEQVALAIRQASLYAQLQSAYNELRQTQQSVIEQERLRALGTMASGIAHDINNALSPVLVYSDLLFHEDLRMLPRDEVQRQLEHIRTAGEDIAHIVSRMREFYRRREQKEKITAANLNKLAGQVVDMTRPRWRDIPQERGLVIEVKTDFESGLPDIAGNDSELRELITNLMLNAVDAMPSGGKIIIHTATRCQDAGSNQAPTHVVLEVRDTGAGMDEETRQRCLEPFFTTKGQRGTGLGLAMVYGVTERHEGKIEIESAPGKGTTFRLIFPIHRVSPADATQAVPAPARTSALRILCIDDEPLLRQMLREILEKDGHSVELADGGEAGIAAFQAATKDRPFQVVITDLGMPRVDGRQVASILKKESPATPVIMLTGWGTMMKADGDIPVNVDCVLGKPPRMAELAQALRQVTHHN